MVIPDSPFHLHCYSTNQFQFQDPFIETIIQIFTKKKDRKKKVFVSNIPYARRIASFRDPAYLTI